LLNVLLLVLKIDVIKFLLPQSVSIDSSGVSILLEKGVGNEDIVEVFFEDTQRVGFLE
jgi:hypothetical protein